MAVIAEKTKRPILGGRFRYRPNCASLKLSPEALMAKKRIETKISNGTYRYETCACYCGSRDSVLISETDRYGFFYPLVLCKDCGIMRPNPRLNAESYVDLYTNDYRSLYGDNDLPKDSVYDEKIRQGEAIYKFIHENINLPEKAVIFDIGCNMGTALVPFAHAGYGVIGVDYGREYVEFGKKKTGLDLRLGGIEKLMHSGKKGDLVILNHVLEHFLHLERELSDIRAVMKPGGFVYVALPGIFWWIKNVCAGDIMGLLQNAHTWQFSLSTLRYAMECCGFDFVCGNEEVRSLFSLRGNFRKKEDVPKDEFEKVLAHLRSSELWHLPRYYASKVKRMING